MCKVVYHCTLYKILTRNVMETIKNASVSERQKRKSLAVDQATYDLLEDICLYEYRSRIDQLKVLIENEHKLIFGEKNRGSLITPREKF